MYRFACVAAVVLLARPGFSKEPVQPVVMGAGEMTFQTVPGWGLSEDGQSQIGSTHGGVAVSDEGLIYTSSSLGIFVFNAGGEVVNRFLGDDYSNYHDIELRREGDDLFLFGARNKNAEGIKISAMTGDVIFRLPFPKESELNLKRFSPTAITVGPEGDIYLSDGYASNVIFRFSSDGKYKTHFGKKGNGLKEFNTAHGMTLDTRYQPNRLLICDRNHQPKGRLLHYDLEGNYLEEVITGLGMPTSVSIHGDFVSVPDLHGRLVILDKTNTIVSVLGNNPDRKQGRNFNVPQEQWVEGIFSGTHGSDWDTDGNLYIQDWNVSGRIMKLQRLK